MKPEESSPAEPKPPDPKPEERKPDDPKPGERKPADPKPADPKPAGLKPAEPFGRTVRRLAIAWLALVVLLLLTLGGAYLKLGSGNLWLGLAIAAIKAAIVVWLYMRLGESRAMVKLTAAAGLLILTLLAGLSATDYTTRLADPAVWSSPLQIGPFIQKGR